jgi:O-antigen/teichoic acid export membrane protein
VLLLSIRGLNTAAKFSLALYTARYLGLADLGIYGLMVAATTIAPAFAGLGTTDWIVRQIAGAPSARAVPLIVTRLAMGLAFHLVVQPIAWAVNAVLGAPVPWPLALLLGMIAVADHLAADAGDMLTFRGRALFSNVLLFLRAGLWPLAVIGWGVLDPAARSLECLMFGWLAGLVIMWATLAIFVARRGRWRHLGLEWRWIGDGIRASVPFFLKDISVAASLYLDRFLVSLFLGLELTGVYTFFWSLSNVVHNLALYGTFQPHVSKLIVAGQRTAMEFQTVLRRIQIETAGFALLMAAGLVIVVPLLVPHLDRPLLTAHLSVFGIIVAATLLRLAADSYNFVLLALHHDRAIAATSLVGVPLSAGLTLLLLPYWGLLGAAWAYLLAAGVLLASRLYFGRGSVTFAT